AVDVQCRSVGTPTDLAPDRGQVLLSGVSGLSRVPPGRVGGQAASAAWSGSSVSVSPACRAACSAAAFAAASASIVSVAARDSSLVLSRLGDRSAGQEITKGAPTCDNGTCLETHTRRKRSTFLVSNHTGIYPRLAVEATGT